MGGRAIEDRSSWVGKGKDGVVFPAGAKMKKESGAEGVGGLANYEDSAEKIKAQQAKNKSKVQSHAQKPGFRN